MTRPPFEPVSERDIRIVSAQLGRPPRDVVGIAARCVCGNPTVVSTQPRRDDGTPFPTFYYLCHPAATSAISELEANGVMAELTLLLDDPARYAGAAILYGTVPWDAGVPTDSGRLAGVPVLVAQGDQDTVIPRELLDRTWTWLHDESGAVVTARRDPGGHGITPATLAAVGDWLSRTTAPPTP